MSEISITNVISHSDKIPFIATGPDFPRRIPAFVAKKVALLGNFIFFRSGFNYFDVLLNHYNMVLDSAYLQQAWRRALSRVLLLHYNNISCKSNEVHNLSASMSSIKNKHRRSNHPSFILKFNEQNK